MISIFPFFITHDKSIILAISWRPISSLFFFEPVQLLINAERIYNFFMVFENPIDIFWSTKVWQLTGAFCLNFLPKFSIPYSQPLYPQCTIPFIFQDVLNIHCFLFHYWNPAAYSCVNLLTDGTCVFENTL